MVLFTEEYINQYRNDAGIKSMLDGIQLLNKEEFLKWYRPKIEFRETLRSTKKLQSTRQMKSNLRQTAKSFRVRNSLKRSPRFTRTRQTSASNRPNTPLTVSHVEKQLAEIDKHSLKIFQEIANNICANIGQDYGRSAILNSEKKSNFDILIAVIPGYKDVKTQRDTIKGEQALKMKKILGFIIAEKGECKRMKNAYSVNLICVRPLNKYKIKGSVLLGAYLYCIKSYKDKMEFTDGVSNPVDQVGILELANGYVNLEGFFSYSKLGFVKDLSLHGEDCFADDGNLPMSAPMSSYDDPQHIIQIVTGQRPIPEGVLLNSDDTGLIQTGFKKYIPNPKIDVEKKLQMCVADVANYFYRSKLTENFEKVTNYKNSLENLLRSYIELKNGTGYYSDIRKAMREYCIH